MYSDIRKRAARLLAESSASVFTGRKIGLEKESLRVMAAGGIAASDHPSSLGAALTHPSVTTDFSEALLEMVTPPCDSAQAALDYLTGIHQFIANRLPDDEYIWNTSMPCILHGADSVRIGEYGNSHSGRMKHAYRRGLGVRYGRRMQAIAGVHFNFSLPESCWPLWARLQQEVQGDLQVNLRSDNAVAPSSAVGTNTNIGANTGTGGTGGIGSNTGTGQLASRAYFQMMQQLIRIGWTVPYLFGASPAICKSFLAAGEQTDLDIYNSSTLYSPYATSLRMGKIGYRYREDEPIDLSVRHTSLQAYIEDIIGHVTSPHPPYAAIGLRDASGDIQQLSTHRLQIENEYYGTVRPKQIPEAGELPIIALQKRGIRYLELRSVDVNVLDPIGVHAEQVAMLELLMIFAWLSGPMPLSNEEMEACTQNIKLVAHRGREPGLQLQCAGDMVDLGDWGMQLMDCLIPVAEWLDADTGSDRYSVTVARQRQKFENPDMTPSAEILQKVRDAGSFFEFAHAHSLLQQSRLGELPVDDSLQQQLQSAAEQSVLDQVTMEAQSTGSFDDFLAAYLQQLPQPTTQQLNQPADSNPGSASHANQ